ncbi:MAG: signal recognition particle-docking protein FtsY [candidate division WOR-3 bacterium]|nr:signal recognition particle-docking protein FtsY [candidate division WOR-3 bacterium]MDH5683035.1 signal recognition particle-docking protein FtsY [candidate division WOR-3 bacterium]
MKSVFERIKNGLKKTREKFHQFLKSDNIEELEAALLGADVGVKASSYLIEKIKGKSDKAEILRQEITNLLKTEVAIKEFEKPEVIMIVGVNGSGKTTTIGKIAYQLKNLGEKVLIAASDTYRDAAAPQLKIWAERANVEIVASEKSQDAAAVTYDAIKKAYAKGLDVVLVDTAGRLHTRKDLMEEAKKIKRTITKLKPDAPDEIWLVLDATVGQNGIAQAKIFHQELGITGIIVTKLDGTAKGGVIIPIACELNLPIKYLGIGEGIEDLEVFSAEAFAQALLQD